MDELVDVTDSIKPEEDPKYFNDDECLELHEMCLNLMEEFILDNHHLILEPDFDETFDENINELMHAHFDFDIFYNDDAEDEMNEIIEHAKQTFFHSFMPIRSHKDSIILSKPNIDEINLKLEWIRNQPKQDQSTKKWRDFRDKLLTASTISKAFGSQSEQNQLIYDKCRKINNIEANIDNSSDEDNSDTEVVVVNTNSTLHKGHQYEPVSVEFYENQYNTSIELFGCIQHRTYLFIGASPDGINVDKTSDRYGRMLEIKNIINREINGIPKKEYWVQMQIQMEVCDLNECDFLETRFIEYSDFSAFKDDSGENICISNDGKMKGIMIHFHTTDGTPFYAYKPLNIIDVDAWVDNTLNQYHHLTFIKNIYWKLEEYSCVLVCRNRHWFKEAIDELKQIWNIIETERVAGYVHRAPKKVKKDVETNNNDNNNVNITNKCLLKMFKPTVNVIKIDTDILTDENNDGDCNL